MQTGHGEGNSVIYQMFRILRILYTFFFYLKFLLAEFIYTFMHSFIIFNVWFRNSMYKELLLNGFSKIAICTACAMMPFFIFTFLSRNMPD